MVLFYLLLFTLAASPALTARGFNADLLQILRAFNLLVVPRTEVARGVTALEAVCGQLYVAVAIASLVGARLRGHG